MGRDITQCHPRLQAAAAELVNICNSRGLKIKIGECFRSKAEQDELYAQGRTKPGNIVTNAPGSSYSSMHQWGVAFDFFKNIKGHEYDDTSFFREVGAIGKSLGLEWGGDWTSPVDMPHLQLADWGSTPSKLKRLYGTFDNFKATWEEVKVPPITTWKGTGVKVCIVNDQTVFSTPGSGNNGTIHAGSMVEVDGTTDQGYSHVAFPATGLIGWVPTNTLIDYKPWKGTGIRFCIQDGVAVSILPGQDQIGTLNAGDNIEIDGTQKDGYAHVALPAAGVYGYVPADMIEEWKAVGVKYGITNDLPIRANPKDGARIIGGINKDGAIEVDGHVKDGWIHVGVPKLGIYGWMKSNLRD